MAAQAHVGVGAIPALVQAVNRFVDRPEQHSRLVDNKGIGKPTTFDGTESKYREWSAKFESFVVGVYGEDFMRVLEWAVERQTTVERGHWQTASVLALRIR